MSRALKPGDRVRVTAGGVAVGRSLGDKGTILGTAQDTVWGGRCYLVAMDKSGPDSNGVIFTEDEIEPNM
jgi:hypothetical protein